METSRILGSSGALPVRVPGTAIDHGSVTTPQREVNTATAAHDGSTLPPPGALSLDDTAPFIDSDSTAVHTFRPAAASSSFTAAVPGHTPLFPTSGETQPTADQKQVPLEMPSHGGNVPVVPAADVPCTTVAAPAKGWDTFRSMYSQAIQDAHQAWDDRAAAEGLAGRHEGTVVALEGQMKDMQGDMSRLRSANASLRRTRLELSSTVTAQEETIKGLQGLLAQFEASQQALRQEVHHAKVTATAAVDETARVREELRAVKVEAARSAVIETTNVAAALDTGNLMTQLQAKTKEADALSQQLSLLPRDNAAFQEKILRLESDSAVLQGRLRDSGNSTAVFVESVALALRESTAAVQRVSSAAMENTLVAGTSSLSREASPEVAVGEPDTRIPGTAHSSASAPVLARLEVSDPAVAALVLPLNAAIKAAAAKQDQRVHQDELRRLQDLAAGHRSTAHHSQAPVSGSFASSLRPMTSSETQTDFVPPPSVPAPLVEVDRVPVLATAAAAPPSTPPRTYRTASTSPTARRPGRDDADTHDAPTNAACPANDPGHRDDVQQTHSTELAMLVEQRTAALAAAEAEVTSLRAHCSAAMSDAAASAAVADDLRSLVRSLEEAKAATDDRCAKAVAAEQVAVGRIAALEEHLQDQEVLLRDAVSRRERRDADVAAATAAATELRTELRDAYAHRPLAFAVGVQCALLDGASTPVTTEECDPKSGSAATQDQTVLSAFAPGAEVDGTAAAVLVRPSQPVLEAVRVADRHAADSAEETAQLSKRLAAAVAREAEAKSAVLRLESEVAAVTEACAAVLVTTVSAGRAAAVNWGTAVSERNAVSRLSSEQGQALALVASTARSVESVSVDLARRGRAASLTDPSGAPISATQVTDSTPVASLEVSRAPRSGRHRFRAAVCAVLAAARFWRCGTGATSLLAPYHFSTAETARRRAMMKLATDPRCALRVLLGSSDSDPSRDDTGVASALQVMNRHPKTGNNDIERSQRQVRTAAQAICAVVTSPATMTHCVSTILTQLSQHHAAHPRVSGDLPSAASEFTLRDSMGRAVTTADLIRQMRSAASNDLSNHASQTRHPTTAEQLVEQQRRVALEQVSAVANVLRSAGRTLCHRRTTDRPGDDEADRERQEGLSRGDRLMTLEIDEAIRSICEAAMVAARTDVGQSTTSTDTSPSLAEALRSDSGSRSAGNVGAESAASTGMTPLMEGRAIAQSLAATARHQVAMVRRQLDMVQHSKAEGTHRVEQQARIDQLERERAAHVKELSRRRIEPVSSPANVFDDTRSRGLLDTSTRSREAAANDSWRGECEGRTRPELVLRGSSLSSASAPRSRCTSPLNAVRSDAPGQPVVVSAELDLEDDGQYEEQLQGHAIDRTQVSTSRVPQHHQQQQQQQQQHYPKQQQPHSGLETPADCSAIDTHDAFATPPPPPAPHATFSGGNTASPPRPANDISPSKLMTPSEASTASLTPSREVIAMAAAMIARRKQQERSLLLDTTAATTASCDASVHHRTTEGNNHRRVPAATTATTTASGSPFVDDRSRNPPQSGRVPANTSRSPSPVVSVSTPRHVSAQRQPTPPHAEGHHGHSHRHGSSPCRTCERREQRASDHVRARVEDEERRRREQHERFMNQSTAAHQALDHSKSFAHHDHSRVSVHDRSTASVSRERSGSGPRRGRAGTPQPQRGGSASVSMSHDQSVEPSVRAPSYQRATFAAEQMLDCHTLEAPACTQASDSSSDSDGRQDEVDMAALNQPAPTHGWSSHVDRDGATFVDQSDVARRTAAAAAAQEKQSVVPRASPPPTDPRRHAPSSSGRATPTADSSAHPSVRPVAASSSSHSKSSARTSSSVELDLDAVLAEPGRSSPPAGSRARRLPEAQGAFVESSHRMKGVPAYTPSGNPATNANFSGGVLTDQTNAPSGPHHKGGFTGRVTPVGLNATPLRGDTPVNILPPSHHARPPAHHSYQGDHGAAVHRASAAPDTVPKQRFVPSTDTYDEIALAEAVVQSISRSPHGAEGQGSMHLGPELLRVISAMDTQVSGALGRSSASV